ncbi:MAG: YebC/PmpR family DNA-binding transcriptional regulator [Candidatus Andersenbacteria bacterium]
MSGHSKWSQIKRAKEVTDNKRSQLFGKLSHDILLATTAGTDPKTNNALKDAIDKARKGNMPQVNIDRLLERQAQKGSQTAIYEGFGPGGTAILVVTLTDNPNRTVAELRAIMKSHGMQLGVQGSVQWKFDEHRAPKYPIELSEEFKTAADALIDDLEAHNDTVQIVTDIL